MFLTFFLLTIALALVVAVKARFDSLPPLARGGLLTIAALITAFVFTVEFFIWLKQRLAEFLDAVEGIPAWIVALVFLALAWFAYRGFRFLSALNQEEIGRLFRENVTPHLKEMASDVRQAWRRRTRWRLLPWWGRGSQDQEEKDADAEDSPENTGR